MSLQMSTSSNLMSNSSNFMPNSSNLMTTSVNIPVPSITTSNIPYHFQTGPTNNINSMLSSSNGCSIMVDQLNSMNSLHFYNGDTTNGPHQVDMVRSVELSGEKSLMYDVNDSLSKSAILIDSSTTNDKNSTQCNNKRENGHVNGMYHNGEIDLTDGIPSLGDLSSSGIEECGNLDSSPYTDGSPLSHSLASSVASNMSLDDTLSSRTDTSSYTDTQDTVVAIVQKTPSLTSNNRVSHKEPSKTIKPLRNAKSSMNGSTESRLHPSEYTSRTPECRRRGNNVVASPRLDGVNKSTKSSPGLSRSSPRYTDRSNNKLEDKKKSVKVPVHDRRTCRSISGGTGSTIASRSKMIEQDAPRKSRGVKIDTKDSKVSENAKTYGTLERKKKEKGNKEEEYDSGTLGRRKKKFDKEYGNESSISWRNGDAKEVEKYGTLGRRKKVREAGDGKDDCHGALSKESKETLDTYATLPRRRAKEMTARWRDQNLQNGTEAYCSIQVPETINRPLRRSRSIGKGESCRSIASFATNNTANNFTSRPANGRLSSSRLTPGISPVPSPRPAIATQTTRKEKTIICLESAIQTALVGHEVAAAMRALAKVRNLEEKSDSRPKIEIVRDYPLPMPPKSKPSHCNAQIQVSKLCIPGNLALVFCWFIYLLRFLLSEVHNRLGLIKEYNIDL